MIRSFAALYLPARCSCRIVVTLTGLCLPFVGCKGSEDYQTVTPEDAEHAEAAAGHDHEHHHDAPHGGHLIELGEHAYNAEVLLEADPRQLVVYLLDAHAEHPVAIESPSLEFTPEESEPITLKPEPQEQDPQGRSSRFVASGPALEAWGDAEDIHGSLSVTIKGTAYSGELSHDHEHEHEH